MARWASCSGCVCAGGPALMRQAMAEDVDGGALAAEPAGAFIAFLVDDDPGIAAAGDDEDGRAIRLLRTEDGERGPRDVVGGAIQQAVGIVAFDNLVSSSVTPSPPGGPVRARDR